MTMRAKLPPSERTFPWWWPVFIRHVIKKVTGLKLSLVKEFQSSAGLWNRIETVWTGWPYYSPDLNLLRQTDLDPTWHTQLTSVRKFHFSERWPLMKSRISKMSPFIDNVQRSCPL